MREGRKNGMRGGGRDGRMEWGVKMGCMGRKGRANKGYE